MVFVDRFTKFLLTLIAVALLVIAFRSVSVGVFARAENLGQTCRLDPEHPCYVAGWGPSGTVPIANSQDLPIKVLVTNAPVRPVPVAVVPSGIGR